MKVGTIVESLPIVDISAEGLGVGKMNDFVFFVKGTVPGDVIHAMVSKKKSGWGEARLLEIVTPSAQRIQPFCNHFGICGGCKWQNMSYATQLQYKESQVVETIRRIGKTEAKKTSPILGSSSDRFYRNKMEYSFSEKGWLTEKPKDGEYLEAPPALGFHIPGKFDKILNITHCSLQPEPANTIRNHLYDYAIKNQLRFFHPKTQEGWLRSLILRNTLAGEWMVIVVVTKMEEELLNPMLQSLLDAVPEINHLLYIINNKRNDTINDLPYTVFKGKDYLTETMEDLQFRIGPYSFYQTNPAQAYQLYRLTREMAGLTGSENLYDLYTGTGTIAQFVARQCKQVVGIEYVPEAIRDAQVNVELNALNNLSFYAGDMKDILNENLFEKHGKPDVIITDPPRAGMHEQVVQQILKAAPEKIVYVSCNPSTQARDIQLMAAQYSLEAIQPVDMFPQTQHVENIALLQKK